MRRKLIISTLLVILICIVESPSQTSTAAYTNNDKYFFGLSGGHSGIDSRLGIEWGSSSLYGTSLAFRINSDIYWLEYYKASKGEWQTYGSIGFNLIYYIKVVERARISFEAGPFVVFPSIKFSDKNHIEGMSAVTGVELLVSRNKKLNVTYYFNGGINYIKAYAEKLEHKPRYANGFVFNNGFRIYF